MKALKTTHMAPLALLLGLALGSPGLNAQEGPDSYMLKIRVGLTAGDLQKSHYDNKVMGFAAEYRRELKDMFGGRFNGAFIGELAWEYVPGRHHDIYPWGTNPLKRYNTNPPRPDSMLDGLDIRYSADNRKEYGQGFNLKFGYASKMPQVFGPYLNDIAKGLEWFAGIGLDRYKVRSEVKWTFIFYQTIPPPTNGGQAYPELHDGGADTKEQAQIVPGVFAGLKYKLNSDIGFELSLRNFGMWHYEFTPYSYSTDYVNFATDYSKYGTGTSSTGTSRGWALEFAVTAKL